MNISPNTISHQLANYVAKNNLKYKNEQDQIRYGLEWVISGLYQFLSVVFIGYIFNVISFAIVALFTGALLRMFSGGIHLQKYFKCYLYSTVTILLTAIISRNYGDYLFSSIIYYSLVVLTFIIFAKNAPKLYKTNELYNDQEKNRFKFLSLALLLFFFLLAEFIIHDQRYIFCIWTSIALQAFTLSKIGEKVILYLDKITK